MTRFARSLILCLVAAWPAAIAPSAYSAENIRQYRAAITQIFLGKYQAMPIFRLNPAFPGDVITLKNETQYVKQKECYPQVKVGNYRAISDYKEGQSVSLSGDLKIEGALIIKEIADIEADGKVNFAKTGIIIIAPLAIDELDSATLNHWKRSNPDCQIIDRILTGNAKGVALTQAVLHGRVGLVLTANLGGSVGASAQGALLKQIAGVFKINEAEIKVLGKTASFAVSESPGPMSLAIVPSGFSFEELARITLYLQGQRGANLEIAVKEAINASDLNELRKWQLRIEEIFGNDELKNKERWAENMVGTVPVEKVRTVGRDTIDFQKVGTYAAGMELVRLEAPARGR